MIQIYDTTLRDGTQRAGISLSAADKIRIARRLDELGFAFIEGRLARFESQGRRVLRPRARHPVADDGHRGIRLDLPRPGDARRATPTSRRCSRPTRPCAPSSARRGRCTSPMCCERRSKTTCASSRRAWRTCGREGRRVIYDAEHFFDGYKADAGYALETLRAAVRGGAETVVLCDTNGGTMPWEIGKIVRELRAQLQHPIGIHTHNDGECAVANTLAAIREGAIQVQGTINGYGERCGNANLCSIIPDLELKLNLRCLPEGKLETLSEVSHFVAEVANLAPDDHLAYVGKHAFAHKGGIHVAAMRRTAQSYQHIDPRLVGNEMSVVVSELSGRGNLLSKAAEYGIDAQGEQLTGVLDEIKVLEAQGFAFEAAEASVAMMMKRLEPNYRAPFELIDFVVTVEHRRGRGIFSEATVKVRVPGSDEVLHTAAEGNGPVNALDLALRKALTRALSRAGGVPARRLQSPHPERHRGDQRRHPRPDRHAQRHRAMDDCRRQREHHRSQLARACGRDRIRAHDRVLIVCCCA